MRLSYLVSRRNAAFTKVNPNGRSLLNARDCPTCVSIIAMSHDSRCITTSVLRNIAAAMETVCESPGNIVLVASGPSRTHTNSLIHHAAKPRCTSPSVATRGMRPVQTSDSRPACGLHRLSTTPRSIIQKIICWSWSRTPLCSRQGSASRLHPQRCRTERLRLYVPRGRWDWNWCSSLDWLP